MELLSKLLEQKAFNTRLKIEEHMLIVVDKRRVHTKSIYLKHYKLIKNNLK